MHPSLTAAYRWAVWEASGQWGLAQVLAALAQAREPLGALEAAAVRSAMVLVLVQVLAL
jgi:hypothetical protein